MLRVNMRRLASILTLLLASASVHGQQPAATVHPCAVGEQGCDVSKQDRKRAKQEYSKGLKYQLEHRNDDAFEAFEEAATLVPKDVEYQTAKELARQQRITEHLERGNQ